MKKITLLFALFFALQISFAQDTCATAATATVGTTSVGTVNGTYDNTCGWTNAATFGEWYVYTATVDGIATVSSDLAQNDGITLSDDTRVSIFSGTCGSLTCIAGNDDVSDTNYLSEVGFVIETGMSYYILWDDYWSDVAFDFTITETVVNCDFSLPYSEDVSDANTIIACWDNVDSDGDGFGWFTADYDLNGDTLPDGNPCLGSASWNSTVGPLTPDNWLISGAIDLTGLSTSDTVELMWKARGIDATYADENYTVYVATGNQTSDFLSSPVSFNEIIGQNGGAGTTFVDRTLDIASLAGNMVYVAFRHWNVSDEFVLNIDDIAITYSLGVEDFENRFAQISCVDRIVTISQLQGDASYRIFSITGQVIKEGSTTLESQDVSLETLSSGLYIVEVSDVNSNAVVRKKVVI